MFTKQYKLDLILERLQLIMTAIDDLNGAVTALTDGFTTLDTAIQAELTAITGALASNNTTAIETSVANISKITSTMAADAAALTASLPVVPAPVTPVV